jgi:hypothetical protein
MYKKYGMHVLGLPWEVGNRYHAERYLISFRYILKTCNSGLRLLTVVWRFTLKKYRRYHVEASAAPSTYR